jgi:hypothetical protein
LSRLHSAVKIKKGAGMRILKRVSLCVLLALTASILSGCIRVDCDITVKDNGKADISVLFAMQGMTEGEGSLFDDEELAALRKEGWEVTDYAEDDYGGFIVSQKNVELSEIPLLDGEGSLRKEGSLYILDLYLAEDEDSQSLMESGSMIKGAGGYYTVHLTLPSKPVKHNATSVSEDGKTLEWDLFSMKTSDPIHVEYRQSS